MSLTNQQMRSARTIDTWVKDILKRGGGDVEILEGMHDYMATFKQIMDVSTDEEMNMLGAKYEGFYRFAKLLEDLARGIADGTISVPGKAERDK